MTEMEVDSSKKIQEILAAALGIDENEVQPEASLTEDLGAESIDFIDIIFRLEKGFDIEIPSGELFPPNIFDDDRFVQDGMVTKEGLTELETKVPYMDIETFAKDPQISKLSEQFTVQMIVNYINDRLVVDDNKLNTQQL
jgi:acyl carrier protein